MIFQELESTEQMFLNDFFVLLEKRTSGGILRIIREKKTLKEYLCLESNNNMIIRRAETSEYLSFDKVAEWILSTMSLSKQKQSMRIPPEYMIAAMGTDIIDVDIFLNNERKNGIVKKLRRDRWFQGLNNEEKTAALKLFAHLGLFIESDLKKRDDSIEKIKLLFHKWELYNLFANLEEGASPLTLNKKYDSLWGITEDERKRYDSTGTKAINFFWNCIRDEAERKILPLIFSNFVFICIEKDKDFYSNINLLENIALQSSDPNFCLIAKNIRKLQLEASVNYSAQRKIAEFRNNLILHASTKTDELILGLYSEIIKSRKRVCPNDFVDFYEKKPSTMMDNFSTLLDQAGYKAKDQKEITALCKMFNFGRTAQPKNLYMPFCDSSIDGYGYLWMEPNNPLLCVTPMFCGGTCMRPGFSGEAALWECVTNPNVMLCAILNRSKHPILYIRTIYYPDYSGILVDTIETRISNIYGNASIWGMVKRALIDLAEANNKSSIRIKRINIGEENSKRFEKQWNELPASSCRFKKHIYYHQESRWTYGSFEEKEQRTLWEIAK